MDAVEGHEGIRCGWLLEQAGRPCGAPATYLAVGGNLVASDAPWAPSFQPRKAATRTGRRSVGR